MEPLSPLIVLKTQYFRDFFFILVQYSYGKLILNPKTYQILLFQSHGEGVV